MIDILIVVYAIITTVASFWCTETILFHGCRRYGIRDREGWRAVVLVPLAWGAGLMLGAVWPFLLVWSFRNLRSLHDL